MEKINLRKVNAGELHAIKKQVVRLKELGRSGAEIEELTGVNESTVSRIWRTYLKEGAVGLKPSKRGRKKGVNLLLTPDEERSIRRTIIDNAPEQLKLAGCLWTRQKICDYIKREYGKDVVVAQYQQLSQGMGIDLPAPHETRLRTG